MQPEFSEIQGALRSQELEPPHGETPSTHVGDGHLALKGKIA